MQVLDGKRERGHIRPKATAHGIDHRLCEAFEADEQVFAASFFGKRDESALGPWRVAEVDHVDHDIASLTVLVHSPDNIGVEIVLGFAIREQENHFGVDHNRGFERREVIGETLGPHLLDEPPSVFLMLVGGRIELIAVV